MSRLLRMIAYCLSLPLLVACGKSIAAAADSENGSFVVCYGTVAEVSPLTLRTDGGKMLWVTDNLIPSFVATQGMRIRFNYTPLAAATETEPAKVRLNAIQQMLSKLPAKSSELTPEQLAALGTDPVQVNEAWFGDNYLNVVFTVLRSDVSQPHAINLLIDQAASTPELVTLEIRHNAYGDLPRVAARGRVSFLLSDLVPAGATSVRVRIRWRDYEDRQQEIFGRFTKENTDIVPLVTSLDDEDVIITPNLSIK